MTDPAAQRDGQSFLELVSVMDTLRSPGGCPWDAEQTHESLVQYALEEAYEVAEAVETSDREALREELGDLLLQVVFHARIAAEDPEDPFTIDDVADGIVAKLRRRHPHVFPDADGVLTQVDGAADVNVAWDRIKVQEKQRTSVLEGIPVAQSALARAQKVIARARRGDLGLDPVAEVTSGEGSEQGEATSAATHDIGVELIALAARADAAGVDAEKALRAATRALEASIVAKESARS